MHVLSHTSHGKPCFCMLNNKDRAQSFYIFCLFQKLLEVPSSISRPCSGNGDNKLKVRVCINENGEQEFRNLMSLASTGIKPLADDVVEADEIDRTFCAGEKKGNKPANNARRKGNSYSSK